MSHAAQQNFIGTAVAGVAAKAAVGVVEKVAERILKRDDVAMANSQAPGVATEIAKSAAPAVVEAIKKDPVIRAAINGEPWYQSVIFWFASAGGATALWTLVELWFQQPPAATSLWVSALGTLFGTIGVLLRRLQFTPGT